MATLVNLKVNQWLVDFPDQAERFERLLDLSEALIKGKLTPFGLARAIGAITLWVKVVENE